MPRPTTDRLVLRPAFPLLAIALTAAPGVAAVERVPSWTELGPQRDATFGFSLATAGDVNGDGFADAIVGAPLHDADEINEGRAYVYHGSAAGLAASPAWTVDSGDAGGQLGRTVSTAGDVNGDGFDDVIVGAPSFGSGGAEGKVFVYLGSAGGLSVVPSWEIVGDQSFDNYGAAVGTAGDVNGDGYDDVIVGAPQQDETGNDNRGRSFVYLGSPGGLATTPAFERYGSRVGAQFGSAVGTAGDVNGDGYDDIIVGAIGWSNGQSDEGAFLVFHGSASGVVLSPSQTIESNQTGAFLGRSVGTAGDVNGDGYADVIAGADGWDHLADSDTGAAFVYLGSPTGVTTAGATVLGRIQEDARFGWSVATAGDVNGDGFADVVVGAAQHTAGQEDEGIVYVHFGSEQSVETTARWTFDGDQFGANAGWSVATAGDVNADGFSDLLVGAPYHDAVLFQFEDYGQVYLIDGLTATLTTAPVWTMNDFTTFTLTDVDADGYDDLVAGDPGFDGNRGVVEIFPGTPAGVSTASSWQLQGAVAEARLGSDVQRAGDVNGDGYEDFLVNDSPGGLDGTLHLFLGAEGGPPGSAAWSVEVPVDGNTEYGYAGAGDVNGDGFGDIVVGGAEAGCCGTAYVYHGSSTGPAVDPDWVLEGDDPGDALGRRVGSAGDVNADGYSDVVIDSGDGVHVVLGSSSGLGGTVHQTIPGNFAGPGGDVNADGHADLFIGWPSEDGDYIRVHHGTSSGVSSSWAWSKQGQAGPPNDSQAVHARAGDLNGDGISDLLFCEPHYDIGGQNSIDDAGRLLVFLGGTGGLGPFPSWNKFGEQFFEQIGRHAVSGGDVNGDGANEVVLAHALGWPVPASTAVHLGNAGDGVDLFAQQLSGGEPVAPLGMSADGFRFDVSSLARTAAGRSRIRLMVEAKPVGTPFDGTGVLLGDVVLTATPGGAGSRALLTLPVNRLTPETAYAWRARVLDDSPYFAGSRWLTLARNGVTESDIRTSGSTVAVEPNGGPTPAAMRLAPNPFTTRSVITIPSPAAARVHVFDVAGRRVAALVNGRVLGGERRIEWDGRGSNGRLVPSGTYIVRVERAGRAEVAKLQLVR